VAKENRMALGSGTSPGGRLVTARRQRYSSGRLKFWLDWFGLKEWEFVRWGNTILGVNKFNYEMNWKIWRV